MFALIVRHDLLEGHEEALDSWQVRLSSRSIRMNLEPWSMSAIPVGIHRVNTSSTSSMPMRQCLVLMRCTNTSKCPWNRSGAGGSPFIGPPSMLVFRHS